MAVGYSIVTAGAVALAAGVAKTILGAKSHANFGLQLKGFDIAFDGVTASAVPALIEVCYCTWATNSPGTASTSVTPAQKYGRLLTVGFTAGKTWTTEPTAITVNKEFLLSPNGGVYSYQYPLGIEPDSALGEGFLLRVTAPAIVNVRASMDFERV